MRSFLLLSLYKNILVNTNDNTIELADDDDDDARKSLNLIETGIFDLFKTRMNFNSDLIKSISVLLVQRMLFTLCKQPISDAMLRMFPQVRILSVLL